MSQARHAPMTPKEFLAWEGGQDLKWEFDGFQPAAMAGGTEAHSTIQANLLGALVASLRGTPCRAKGSDIKVQAGTSYRYPDAFVICTPIVPAATVVTEPVIIFEVISKDTEITDRYEKLREYRSIASL